MDLKELLNMRVDDESVISPKSVTTMLEKLSWLDARIDMPVNREYLRSFRKRRGSVLIIARPATLEKMADEPLGFQYTCDDFLIFEYDAAANDVPKIVVSRLAKEESRLVDGNDGLLIIGN